MGWPQPSIRAAVAKVSSPVLPPQQIITMLFPVYFLRSLMKHAIAIAAAPSTGPQDSSLLIPSNADAISLSDTVIHSSTNSAHGPNVIESVSIPPADMTKLMKLKSCIWQLPRSSKRLTFDPLPCNGQPLLAYKTCKAIWRTCSPF